MNCAPYSVGTSFTKIHDYLVGEQIGMGTFSCINVGYSFQHKCQIAAKSLNKRRIKRMPNGEQILFNETVLFPSLTHDSIVNLLDIIENREHYILIMESVTGGNLLEVLSRRNFTKDEKIVLMSDILLGLRYLHHRSVCHRDIKPENILVTANGRAKICDFGLASVTIDGQLHDHRGSIDYSPLEAISNGSFDGFASDIWSCGSVFYSICSGKALIRGEDGICDISELNGEFEELIWSMLNVDPNKRPSADECLANSIFSTKGAEKSLVEPTRRKIEEKDISKISQILTKPASEVMESLKNPEFGIERWLADRLVERVAIDVNSLKEGQTLKFACTSPILLKNLKKFGYEEDCYWNTPWSKRQYLVQIQNSLDQKIEFRCEDDIENETSQIVFHSIQGNLLFKRLQDFLAKIQAIEP